MIEFAIIRMFIRGVINLIFELTVKHWWMGKKIDNQILEAIYERLF